MGENVLVRLKPLIPCGFLIVLVGDLYRPTIYFILPYLSIYFRLLWEVSHSINNIMYDLIHALFPYTRECIQDHL